MGAVFETYFGGKGGSGTYQKIISEIRPHKTYIEPFLGGGRIFLNKLPADITVLNDISGTVIKEWENALPGIIGNNDGAGHGIELLNKNALKLLNAVQFATLRKGLLSSWVSGRTVIYIDPPYPINSRRSQKDRYEYEMTHEDHYKLLQVAKKFDPEQFDILISTYKNKLYQEELKDWRLVKFQAMTRGGVATEYLYMNYDNPTGELHDYRYLGKDYRERERIRKKINRHVDRLKKLNVFERNAILNAIKQSQYCLSDKLSD